MPTISLRRKKNSHTDLTQSVGSLTPTNPQETEKKNAKNEKDQETSDTSTPRLSEDHSITKAKSDVALNTMTDKSPRLGAASTTTTTSNSGMFSVFSKDRSLRKTSSSSHLVADAAGESKKLHRKTKKKPTRPDNTSKSSTKSSTKSSSSVATLFSRLRHTDTDITDPDEPTISDNDQSSTKNSSSFELSVADKSTDNASGDVILATQSHLATSEEPVKLETQGKIERASVKSEDGVPSFKLEVPKIELDAAEQVEQVEHASGSSAVTTSEEDLTVQNDSTLSSQLSLHKASGSVSSTNSTEKATASSETLAAPRRRDHERRLTSSSESSLSTSTFMLPLSRLKKKTVSMLFSDSSNIEPNEKTTLRPTRESSHSRRSFEKRRRSIEKSPGTPPSLSRTSSRSASPVARPFPLLRSKSSQGSGASGAAAAPEQVEATMAKPAPPPILATNRPRSKTLNSLNDRDAPMPSPAALFASRPSFSSLLAGKLRSEESVSRRHSPSPRQSLNTIRTHAVVEPPPEKLADESAEAFLVRCKELGLGGSTAAILSKSDDAFYHDVLQLYIDSFDFADEPIDMALRKFLMYARLPQETQQIDRVLEAFASTYHRQNPDIYESEEIAYIITFSLMILHTDFFNKSNRHKMQKHDYLKNTYAKAVSKDVLECFYDNITYTPFIHTEEEFLPPNNKVPWSRRSSSFRTNKDLLDPYTLLMECRLEVTRPRLGAVLSLEDPYGYPELESVDAFKTLRQQFVNGPYLQLVSQRSRPEAFLSPDTTADPEHSDPGIVDIKVVKIGILYRREARRMLYSKSTWKEWGAILTASQLYLFKDVSWIKGSVLTQNQQQQTQQAGSRKSTSSSNSSSSTEIRRESFSYSMNQDVSLSAINENSGIIRAPIDGFHPSAVLSTVDMMALTTTKDETSQKHAFLLIGRGNSQDWFAGTDEADMHDWMTKINFAASFNTYHVGIQESDTILPPQRTARASSVDSSATSVSDVDPDDEVRLDLNSKLGDMHAVRVQLVDQKLSEINARCLEKEELIQDHVRNGSHLKILAPLQQRSREAIIFAAGRLAAKLDWHFMDNKRLQCYRHMFSLEKQVESELCVKCKKLNHRTSNESIIAEEENDMVIVTAPGASKPTSIRSARSHPSVTKHANGSTTSLTASVDSQQFDMEHLTTVSSRTPSAKQHSIAPVSSGSTSSTANASAPPVTPAPVKQKFQTSLRDKNMKVRKQRDKKASEKETVARSTSLMRKENGDFTLHGKKFSVVEVNPEFATPKHQREASLSTKKLDPASSIKSGGDESTTSNTNLEPRKSTTSTSVKSM